MELNIPAIEGIGGSLIYLVDRYGPQGSIYDIDFRPVAGVEQKPAGAGLAAVDHLTHNVIAAAWMPGPISTPGSSISARSAISTSRASSPA